MNVVFNIETYKIIVSLFYDEKIDIEKEKGFWINLQGSLKFVNEVGNLLVKSHRINWNLTTAIYFLIENLDMLLLLNLKDDVKTRPFYIMKLLLTEKQK